MFQTNMMDFWKCFLVKNRGSNSCSSFYPFAKARKHMGNIINYEQITDEKKDVKPLLEARDKIDFFVKEYPSTDYALDLRFKRDLIQNQLAAKELYVAKYYISTQKWMPAINRLKIYLKI